MSRRTTHRRGLTLRYTPRPEGKGYLATAYAMHGGIQVTIKTLAGATAQSALDALNRWVDGQTSADLKTAARLAWLREQKKSA